MPDSRRMNVTIWNAARGGMRSVVEAYERDGFVASERIRLIAAYVDGGFVRRQWVMVKALATFSGLLLARRVALVHCHASMRGSFWRKNLFASLARIFGVPVILHLHGSEMKPFYQSQPGFLKARIRSHLEKATRVLVLSESWRTFVSGIAPAARIIVMPNYVALPPVANPALKTARQILFLGLVGERKGVFDLIPAFVRVHESYPDAHLVIGGNGEVERAAALIREYGLEDAISLAGWIDGDRKNMLLAQSAIYILPSYNEGLPMSVLEAMAAGLAVVTTRVGGIPELITDGEDGLLVEAGDRDAIADALIRLLDDAGLQDRLAMAGRARIAAHYSDTAILPRLRDVYRDCEG